MKTIHRAWMIGLLTATALTLSPASSRAEVTPFSIAVYEAIEAGVDYIIAHQEADGSWFGG